MKCCHLRVSVLLTLATLFLLAGCSITNPPSMGFVPTVVQMRQQAGYHLLSIPVNQPDYVLNHVSVAGNTGNRVYTFDYRKKDTVITIEQGKPLSYLTYSGHKIKMRGTTAIIFNSNMNTVLVWTEKGVGVRISAPLQGKQLISLAKDLT